jgi:hypothetical protein
MTTTPIGRLAGSDEHDGICDLRGGAHTLERHSRDQSGLSLRSAGEPIQQFGFDRTGRDRIDANARCRTFERGGFRQPLDRVLAGGVERRTRRASVSHGRREVHNAAAALRLHHAHFMLHAQQHAQDVGIEGGRVALRCLLRHRTGLALGAGVVDRHVEPAEASQGLVDQIAHVVFMAHVGADKFSFHAEAAELLGQGMSLLVAAAGDNNPGALLGEGQSGGTANTGQGAGDQDNGGGHRTSPVKTGSIAGKPCWAGQLLSAWAMRRALATSAASDLGSPSGEEKDFVESMSYLESMG